MGGKEFAQGVVPPFSFTYDGKHSSQLLPRWKFEREQKQLDNVRTLHTFTWCDPETKLEVRCECTSFADFPAVEWVLKFKFPEGSGEKSPLLEDVKALDLKPDLKFVGKTVNGFVLHRSLGSNARRNDFEPLHEQLKPKTEIKLAPVGGCSSNTTSLPFFNIEAVSEGGVIVAIGWSGQWAESFIHEGDGIRICTGMELTRLRLYSGEQIRTPLILLLFWRGDDFLVGQNLFRRFILAHCSPKQNGQPVTLRFLARPVVHQMKRTKRRSKTKLSLRPNLSVTVLSISGLMPVGLRGDGQMVSATGFREKMASQMGCDLCLMH